MTFRITDYLWQKSLENTHVTYFYFIREYLDEKLRVRPQIILTFSFIILSTAV